MRAEIIDQFNSIRQTLSTNVKTIGMLVEQAKTLSEIAENLNGASSVDEATKTKLKEEIDRIQVSIKSLIVQTDILFDLYEKFAEEVFHTKQ
jgi:hypothetical protein